MQISKTSFYAGIILFIFFISCRKEDVKQSISSQNISYAKSKLQFPLAIANSDKSISVINPNSGDVLRYNVWYNIETFKNSLTQSPLFTDSLIINFRGNSIQAIRIKDSSVKWLTTIADVKIYGLSFTSYPCINDNLVMFAFYNIAEEQVNGVYALNINNGEIVWINKDFAVEHYSTPVYNKNTLVVNGKFRFSDNGGYLFAINTINGKTKWNLPVSKNYSPVCIDSNKVFYASTEYTSGPAIYSYGALNLKDGSEIWQKPAGAVSGYCQPLISGNHLYISLRDSLLCINKNTGKTIWKFHPIVSPFYGFCAPYASNGKLFINTNDNTKSFLYALEEANGKLIWKVKINDPGGSEYGTEGPVVMNDKLYYRDYREKLSCYDTSNGNLIFATPLNYYSIAPPYYSPTYVDNNGKMVYSTASGMH